MRPLLALGRVLVVLGVVGGAVAVAHDPPVDLAVVPVTQTGRPTPMALFAGPDPTVVRAPELTGGRYYAFATNGGSFETPFSHIQRFRSDDFVHWTPTAAPDALSRLPDWAQRNYTWAPTVFRAGGEYLMYFTARHRASGDQCIGLAISADGPGGQFVPEASPRICQHNLGGSIDPYYFENPTNGNRFLYFKNDGNSPQCSCRITLWGVRLHNGTGRPLSTDPSAVATPLLDYSPGTWEFPLIENPAMTYNEVTGSYQLFYAGGWWKNNTYATGYATCDGPLGPCDKRTGGAPWHNNTPNAKGPGGAAFFADIAGRNWMAYHGYAPGAVGHPNPRHLFFEKVDFHQTPRINTDFPYEFHRVPPGTPFVDVYDDTFGLNGIGWLADDQPLPAGANSVVATGFDLDPDETFEPSSNITRAQVVRWAWMLSGSPTQGIPANSFNDVTNYYDNAVDWAAHNNLLPGYTANNPAPGCGAAGPAPVWRPDCNITRGDFVRMLWRMDGQPAAILAHGAQDVPAGLNAAVSWALDDVNYPGQDNVMGKYAGNADPPECGAPGPAPVFRPSCPAQRGTVANALYTARFRLWP
jgi:hypothetical protein